MSLVGAAVVPHSPLFLPTVAKDHAALGATIRQATHRVGQLLYATDPTDLIFFTPHGVTISGQAVILTGDSLQGNLREFGDLEPFAASPAIELSQLVARRSLEHGVVTTLQSQAELDYGTIVPSRLFDWPRSVRLLPVSVANLSADQLISLGRAITIAVEDVSARIGIVASCDFSRRRVASERADRPTALERQVARAIRSRRTADLPPLSKQSPCGLAPLFCLLSALEGRAGTVEELLTEAPYGVGAITAWLNV